MCGCGNQIPTVAEEVTPQAVNPVAPMGIQPMTVSVENTMPQWDGNRLVNHKAQTVQVVTGFHLVKSTQ